MRSFLQLPAASHYWLKNVRVPRSLLSAGARGLPGDGEEIGVNLEIHEGLIRSLQPIDTATRAPAEPSTTLSTERPIELSTGIPSVDGHSGLVWPCFVDMHTHLDKGHIWARSPNPDGTFNGALTAVATDSHARWSAEDVYRRAEFGLKCAYAHGTQAIRTHLDAFGQQGEISFEAFRQLRAQWAGRLTLQAVCLVTLDAFMGTDGDKLANLVADSGGILGGVTFMAGGANPDIVQQIDRVFELAQARNLDLDLHTDESLNTGDTALRLVAEAAIRHRFTGKVTCGHCCSLSVQSEATVRETLAWVKAAGISVVSLPMCNLYLQDRQPGRTPRYRGVTLLSELKAAGIPCAIASDNCRDPFFAYGDHDGWEVFTQAVRIGQLDHPLGNWPQAITHTPADIMGLSAQVGSIGPGMKADLVVFQARNGNELLARQQSDRVVIRSGQQIDTTLPSYAELDDLMH